MQTGSSTQQFGGGKGNLEGLPQVRAMHHCAQQLMRSQMHLLQCMCMSLGASRASPFPELPAGLHCPAGCKACD